MYTHNGPWIYQTNDGRLVEQGHYDAAILVVAPGGVLPDEDAKRFGLVNENGDVLNFDLLFTPVSEVTAPETENVSNSEEDDDTTEDNSGGSNEENESGEKQTNPPNNKMKAPPAKNK